MEALVQASNLEWCILRDGLFYCPGTGREEDWQRAAQQGSLRWSRNGEGFRSLIHVADMAQALVRALETAAAGSIYNVVDDLPVWEADLIRYVAAASGAG
jgi:nucleoside-diphosphate-sugar epimerase